MRRVDHIDYEIAWYINLIFSCPTRQVYWWNYSYVVFSIKIMNKFLLLSCLFAICWTSIYGQFQFQSSTSRQTTRQVINTTGRPSGSTSGSSLSCVCSCCSGLRCKPIALRSFVDNTCTEKSCKEKCKVFEPKHCDHTFMGTNSAYCTI
jgi:hypothetical protein